VPLQSLSGLRRYSICKNQPSPNDFPHAQADGWRP
jgi:hypothetical protein